MRISIVTTVKNDHLGIYQTIKNILLQTIFQDIDYVIVDASTDNITSLVIKNLIFKKNNIQYIKTNDNNIYEGINTGVRFCKGDYIGILNSGDIYINNNILKNIVKKVKKKNYNLICANLIYFNSYFIPRVWNLKPIKHNKVDVFKIAHPTVFVNKNIFAKKNLYSTKYFISSDFDFFLKNNALFQNKSLYINKYIIFMKDGGLSTRLSKISIKIFEDMSILFENYSLFFLFFYAKKILIKLPLFFNFKKNKYYELLLSRFNLLAKK